MRTALLALLSLLPLASAQTGPEVPQMAHYDAFFQDLIDDFDLAGAAVAVSQHGRLVYARGFGLADVAADEPVRPTSRFRLASLSKPITAVAVMRLVEDGLLDLDQPAFALLPDLPPRDGLSDAAGLGQITVRHLLLHAGGWDRDGTGYDPMFDNAQIAQAMGVDRPASADDVVRYMRSRPLDFTPGARYAYSNFGYAVLGRIVERVSGQSYEAYTQSVLAEAGITSMEIGGSLEEDRLPGEVSYHPQTELTPSVFGGGDVPWPYGGFYLESMDSHGGWVGSAVDLLKFTTAIDGQASRPDVLTAASLDAISERPDVSTWNGSSYWYGLGFLANGNDNWWHSGSLPGGESSMVRSTYRGLHWAVLWNTRSAFANTNALFAAVDNGMWELHFATPTFPSHDLFDAAVSADGPVEAGAALAVQVAPNPATARSTVLLQLPHAGTVRAEVFDTLGRRVGTVHDGALPGGAHRLPLAGLDLPAGLYVLRVESGVEATALRFTVAR
jgi:N-acyl-D-amino-acid deacylase